MNAVDPVPAAIMNRRAPSRPTHRARNGRLWCLSALLVFALPASVFAHDSSKAVEVEIGDRERYQELTDQVAPVFTLQDVDGNPVSLADFRGKVVILNFLYSRCEEACPLHSVKLSKIQQQISLASISDKIQFITVATDTEDVESTGESIRGHGQRYGLDPANWLFLQSPAGSENLGMRFADVYGLKFVATGDSRQMHGVVTFLIDARGQLRARYHGLNFNPTNLTLHAAALVHDIHNSLEQKTKTNAQSYKFRGSIISLVAFSSVILVIVMAFFYLWRRLNKGISLPPKKLISATQENLE